MSCIVLSCILYKKLRLCFIRLNYIIDLLKIVPEPWILDTDMIWLEPGDLRETLSWNYKTTSSIRYCFSLSFGCFLWSVFENLDLVQNWLQGSSSLTSNITLRGGFFLWYNWCCIMYFELHTSRQFDLEIKNLQLFQSFFSLLGVCLDILSFKRNFQLLTS
jgi:hypothetical protein